MPRIPFGLAEISRVLKPDVVALAPTFDLQANTRAISRANPARAFCAEARADFGRAVPMSRPHVATSLATARKS
jgi:hypothetical protein